VGDVVAVEVVDVVEVADCEAAMTKWGENDCVPVESFRPRKNSWSGVANSPGVQMNEFETRPAMQILVNVLCVVLDVSFQIERSIQGISTSSWIVLDTQMPVWCRILNVLPELQHTKHRHSRRVLTLNMMHNIRITRRAIIQRQCHRTNIPRPSNRKRHTSNNISPSPVREYQCCMDDTQAAQEIEYPHRDIEMYVKVRLLDVVEKITPEWEWE
jgi:hypothetical protein